MKVRRYLKSLIILQPLRFFTMFSCSDAPGFRVGELFMKPYSKADGLQINAGTIYTLYNTKNEYGITLGTMYRAFG